jgi:hypothetical protein
MFRHSICHQAPLLLFVPGMKQKMSIKLCDGIGFLKEYEGK